MHRTTRGTFHGLRATLFLMTIFVSPGCGDQLLAPGDPLVGRWGGAHIELVADANGVVIRMACSWANVPGPFTLGSDKDFEGTGLLYRSSHIDEPLDLRFGERLVQGSGLRLALVLNEDEPVVHLLPAGQACGSLDYLC
jgi:hypothetical protein